jgi:macrolide-specific efflux system membrane fusion protein
MIKFIKWIVIIAVVIAVIVFTMMKLKPKKDSGQVVKEINPTIGSIQTMISTTGIVLPKNRLEIKPPVNGRVESILVKEGEVVKVGQILAWMSSTERAALLDAAQAQGPEQLKYWQEAYKPVALLAPIAGEVIVATIQPGTTVTTADAVVVLSDQLIVRAQVDETDIGKIALGQMTVLSLDAYPDTKIKARVEHIYYESKTVNNVTIYEVDLTPEDMPSFFRSGMNATINFIIKSKDNILIVSLEAVQKDKDESFVSVIKEGSKDPVRQAVVTGVSDDKNVEITSGLSEGDMIVIKTKKFSLPKADIGKNPFTPFGNRKEPERKPK